MPLDNFSDNLRSQLDDLAAELGKLDDLADGVGRTLTRGFANAVTGGKSLNAVLSDIGRSFADIALKAALKPVGNLVSGLADSLFSGLGSAIGGVTPFAKGGVIASPTFFPQSGGLGLAGEAGSEAILPLRRGPDGRLGVASAASGQPISISVNVTASDARSFVGAEAEMSAMLLRAVRRGTRAS